MITKDLQELRHGQPAYFRDNYDAVIVAAKMLFGNSAKIDMKNCQLTIKDRVNLTLYFSGNETKVYIDSYILHPSIDPNDKKDSEFIGKMMKANDKFRFFDLVKVIEYLELKATERDFIQSFEG